MNEDTTNDQVKCRNYIQWPMYNHQDHYISSVANWG